LTTVGHNVSRRTVLGMIASQLANTSIGGALAASAGEKQPNVVFVLVDDVGYGDFACNGNPVIKTPNLDKLHDESVRFREFHVSPTCSPTRAALMTGRYSNATGVWHTIHGRSILGSDNVTMAECFKSSGYRTGIFGKWHLGDSHGAAKHGRNGAHTGQSGTPADVGILC
jgi:arylsulfatase A-like enzyme